MATSTIKFYKNDLLRVDKNFMYSERKESSYFETFLNKSLKKTIDNFQYIKHGLDISIKVKESQTDLYNKATTNLPYNYVSIKNSDSDRIYYYYIVSGTWRSSNCIQYELSMDTIATFWDTIQTSMTDKSTVVREHRDRFYKVNSDLHEGSLLIRKIDPISEGIQVANKIMTQDKIINDDNIPSATNKWYLIYRTEVDVNNLNNIPIKCYLCSNTTSDITTEGLTRLDITQLTQEYTYFFYNELDNGNGGLRFINEAGTTYNFSLNEVSGPGTIKVLAVTFDTNKNKWKVRVLVYDEQNVFIDGFNYYLSAVNPFITFIGSLTKGYSRVISDNPTDYFEWLYNSTVATIIKTTGTLNVWNAISSVDRTQSNLNTIIELPYCPSEGIVYNNTSKQYTYNINIWQWSPTYGMIQLKDLNSEFYRNLVQQYKIPDMVYNIVSDEISSFSINQNKLESKIYHSDFSQLKYVYDSFSMTLDRERLVINGDLTAAPEMEIGYKQSNNITSNLLFDIKFDEKNTNYKEIADKENVLLATRNNEVTIYQDAYINYMRTGYNYDKKAQAIQNRQQIIGVVSSVVQSAASLGFGISNIKGQLVGVNKQNTLDAENIAKKFNIDYDWENARTLQLNPYSPGYNNPNFQRELIQLDIDRDIKKAQVYGTSTQLMIQNSVGIIGSISSAIASKQLQENSMNQKLAELQAQSASTSGSNDLNLLNYYNDNKLHEMKYELTDNMKESVYDLFYYLGYATNIQKKPDLYSRSLFNFIMINPEFDNTLDATVNKEYIEDIKARLASGLTIWHDTIRHTYGYNNTERWILDQYVEE